MGLLSKLTTIGEGSTLSFSDGNTPLINPLAGGGFNDKTTSTKHYSPPILQLKMILTKTRFIMWDTQ
jgi:hypothetical protein